MSLIDLSAAPSLQPQYAARPSVGARGALVNVGARADVLNGRPLTRYSSADSSLKIAPAANGLAIINGYPSQSYSVPLETIGTQAVTIIALIGGAEQSSRSPYYPYALGVYNGTSGLGVSSGNSFISNNWGMYQDGATSLINASETWPTTGLHSVVYTRTTGGSRVLYRNGVVKGTNSNANQSIPAAPLRIGSMYDAGANPFGSEVPVYYAGVFIGEAWSAEQVRALAVNPLAIFAPNDELIFAPSSGATDVTTSGSISSLSLSAATGAAAGSATTSGSVGSVSLSVATGSATSSVSATAAIEAVSLSAASGGATGSATATGAVNTVSLSATTGTASTAGDVTTSGVVATCSLSAATGTATGSATATGSVTSISVSAATGSATAGADVSASGAIATISLAAATGGASAGGDVVASCTVAPISLVAPSGSATGTATTSASIISVSLSAATGTASAGADVSASGSIAVIGLTAPLGASAVSIEAQAALAAIFMPPATGSATGSAVCAGAFEQISLTACRATASNGLEDVEFLRQMLFTRITEQRKFVRVNSPRHFTRGI